MTINCLRFKVQPILRFHLLLCIFSVLGVMNAQPLFAQSCTPENDPNDQPGLAQGLRGEACINGSLTEGDQDLFRWSVDESVDPQRWHIALQGMDTGLTGLQILRIELAENGSDLINSTKLYSFGVLDGNSGNSPSLLFLPGDYYIGLSGAGGTGTYQLEIVADERLAPAGDAGASRETPAQLPNPEIQSPFTISGDLQGEDDYFGFTLSAENASQRWQISAQLPLGEDGYLYLYDEQGNQLDYQQVNEVGQVDLPSLGLTAGNYQIRVYQGRDHFTPYEFQLMADGERTPSYEEEPNDDQQHAWPFDPFAEDAVMEGSFPAGQYDSDFFRFTLDAEHAAKQWEIITYPSTDDIFTLCLLDDQTNQIQCREDLAPFLSDLSLPPGDYYLTLRSRERTAASYTIQFDELGDVEPQREVEPNDNILRASSISEDHTQIGRFVGYEDDYYRFTTSGEPQLWRVQLNGGGLETLSLTEIDGNEVARININGEGSARLDDLYLLPGDHFIRLRGTDGDYSVRILPLGPPAEQVEMPDWENPDKADTSDGAGVTEHEPNDAPDRAERLPFDTPRSGHLSQLSGNDYYRFYLTGNEHVRIVLVQPRDGLVQFDLDNLFFNAHRPDGSPIVYETMLGPGDHYLNIDASQPSEELYYLLLQRLNPLDLPIDLEPFNNQREDATVMPLSLAVSGTVNTAEDYQDWYQLPAPEAATRITIDLTPGFGLDVRSGDEYLSAQDPDRDANIYPFDAPAGAPIYIGVSGTGSYTLAVAYAEDVTVQPLPAPLPLSMTLSAATSAIAAFWEDGQRLDLTLTMTNSGKGELSFNLQTFSSDIAAQLIGDYAQEIKLAAGESRTLPLAVRILPDIDGALATRFAVRAENGNGDFATATVDLPAICAAPASNPDSSWTTAARLRGGLNVAWTGLGSTPVNDLGNDNLFSLFDEIVSPGYGWRGTAEQPITVGLMGEGAMPVAGVILNPFGRTDRMEQLRHFEILLSKDGQNFEEVFSGELAQNAIDQAFVFDQPILATAARLRLIDNWKGEGEIGIGEFKVIAATDYQPAETFNLLDPAHGGHVVSGSPLPENLQEMVTLADEVPILYLSDAPSVPPSVVQWVVGFHHERAALITALHWRNWETGGNPEQRLQQVEIQVSTQSPVGPWQSLTEWTLDPASVVTQSLTLPAPTWARFVRFVRFVATIPEGIRYVELPDQLAIDEAPIDNTYRSILAEWGSSRPQAIFEETKTIHPLGSQISEVEPNDDRQQAQSLADGQPTHGTVAIGNGEAGDEDWFRIDVPTDANTINIVLSGEPVVSVDFELLDSKGAPITRTAEITGGVLLVKAAVEPGTYFLHVLDPKRSIVFTWDTSGSVGPYLTQIYQSMAAFTRDIDPEYEVVNLLPFGDPGQFLLEDFSGEPVQVQQAFNNYPRQESSSSAESNLLAASDALASRNGTRAVVLMTDAESSSYNQTEKLWNSLAAVQPRVFSFEISSGGNTYAQDLMQDWAMVNSGHYANMSTIGAFEQGFARATCLLRRPARYGVAVRLTNEAPPPTPTPIATATPTETPTPEPTATPTATPTPAAPGTLRVHGKQNASGQPQPVIGGGAVELILDASGSMLQLLDGKTRIQVARETLTNLTSNVLPPGTELALRVFGHREAGSCRTDLEIGLQPLDPATVNATIAGINAMNLAKTPIGESLRLVADDLAGATGQKVVILVTDGEETCGGDPAAAIENLRAQGIDVRVNIVGFAVNDPALQASFESWAQLGGGSYFNANNAAELDNAVQSALVASFRVLDASGNEVAQGTVNDDGVSLPAGAYMVEVLTDPVQRMEVTVSGGEEVQVEVGE